MQSNLKGLRVQQLEEDGLAMVGIFLKVKKILPSLNDVLHSRMKR